MSSKDNDTNVKMISQAVKAWYRFYEIDPGNGLSDVLCQAAIELYREGHHSSDDIATVLIGTYVGIHATRVNAPSSAAVH